MNDQQATDRPLYSIDSNRLHIASAAMWTNNIGNNRLVTAVIASYYIENIVII